MTVSRSAGSSIRRSLMPAACAPIAWDRRVGHRPLPQRADQLASPDMTRCSAAETIGRPRSAVKTVSPPECPFRARTRGCGSDGPPGRPVACCPDPRAVAQCASLARRWPSSRFGVILGSSAARLYLPVANQALLPPHPGDGRDVQCAKRVKTKSWSFTLASWQAKQVSCCARSAGLPPVKRPKPQPPESR